MRAQLRYDAGPGVGLGHLRRMEVLGDALRRRGIEVDFGVIGEEPVTEADIVVVDSYTVAASRSRFRCRVVVAIDDLDRPLDVDLVVRPAPTPDRATAASIGELRGFDYALVHVNRTGSTSPAAFDVVVTFGGSDHEGIGAGVSETLADRHPGLRVVHAPGPWSPRADSAGVEVIDAPTGLTGHLRRARLVICAGGVTMIESLAVGRPTIVRPTAPNQRLAVAAVADAGAALVLADDVEVAAIVDAADALMDDPDRLLALSTGAVNLIDGRGPDRVAEAIVGLA